MAWEKRELPKTLPNRDKMEVTCCRTVITSSAESTNLVGETLRQVDPAKLVGEEEVICGRKSNMKKNRGSVVVEERAIFRSLK